MLDISLRGEPLSQKTYIPEVQSLEFNRIPPARPPARPQLGALGGSGRPDFPRGTRFLGHPKPIFFPLAGRLELPPPNGFLGKPAVSGACFFPKQKVLSGGRRPPFGAFGGAEGPPSKGGTARYHLPRAAASRIL